MVSHNRKDCHQSQQQQKHENRACCEFRAMVCGVDSTGKRQRIHGCKGGGELTEI